MAGPEKKEDMTERTCIVTREVKEPDDMIRFVAGPDAQVIPDLTRNLPGRGVWVTASRDLVEQAVKKGAFARGLKAPVKAEKDLPDMVDRLLTEAALGALGFARKAGACVTGADKVQNAILSGKVVGLLHAINGAEDGIRKLSGAARAVEAEKGKPLKVWRLFDSMQLDLALGASNVIHAALTRGGAKGGAARNAKMRMAQLAAYRGNTPLDDAEQKSSLTGHDGPEGKDVDE